MSCDAPVELGVRMAVPLRHRHALALHAVCVSADPVYWKGEVVFAGMTLVSTASVASREEAARNAQVALLELLAGGCA